jgi:protein arginine kinase activator
MPPLADSNRTFGMKKKCDKCNRPATHHEVIIIKGKAVQKNLCDAHAAEEGLSAKSTHTQLDELLTNFVTLHAAGQTEKTLAKIVKADASCESCGMTWGDFKEHSLLGCPRCYLSFEDALSPLIERAQEGGSHHVGKVPRRAGVTEQRQMMLQRLRRRLDDAVEAEDYELAADLRDQLRDMEGQER